MDMGLVVCGMLYAVVWQARPAGGKGRGIGCRGIGAESREAGCQVSRALKSQERDAWFFV
eukprot:scaffold1110_cov78-Cyclotella_meneghiniana.AAC.9